MAPPEVVSGSLARRDWVPPLGASMGKRPKFRLFAPKCPSCGSSNTRFDWFRLDNYRRAVLTAVVALFAHDYAGRYDRVCSDCRHRFTP